MTNKISSDFESLIIRTKRALLSADLPILDSLGVGGSFPYYGPAHSFAREGLSAPLLGESSFPLYNPIKGYTHGLFLRDYRSGDLGPDGIRPLQEIDEFEEIKSTLLKISCSDCGHYREFSSLWEVRATWGSVIDFSGQEQEISGQIVFCLVEADCESGHVAWGHTSMATFATPMPR